MTEVHIASPLRDYTQGASPVRAEGATLTQLLADLDRRYPGIRFRLIDEQQRIRPPIRIFVATREARDLAQPIAAREPVHLLCALSGG
jgi:molybdopterin converting factor small subunit